MRELSQTQADYVNLRRRQFANVWKEFELGGLKITFARNVWCLNIEGFDWMCTNDIDFLDHACIDAFDGDVILTGLGLGLGVLYAACNPRIRSVDILEADQRVIDAVWPMLQETGLLSDRFSLIKCDADRFEASKRYDFAFLDHAKRNVPTSTLQYFESISSETLTWWDEMQKLEGLCQ